MTNFEIIGRTCQMLGINSDVHTYSEWKKLGFIVKKGEKATFKTEIWNHHSKKDENDEEDDAYFYLKKASFFTQEQVEQMA
jgi:antirestriction protein ArdC